MRKQDKSQFPALKDGVSLRGFDETKAFLQQLADQQGYRYQPVVVGGKNLYQVNWN